MEILCVCQLVSCYWSEGGRRLEKYLKSSHSLLWDRSLFSRSLSWPVLSVLSSEEFCYYETPQAAMVQKASACTKCISICSAEYQQTSYSISSRKFGFGHFFLNFLHSLWPDWFISFAVKVTEESRVAWQCDVVLLNSAVYGFQQMFLLQRQCEEKIHRHKFLRPNSASFVSLSSKITVKAKLKQHNKQCQLS